MGRLYRIRPPVSQVGGGEGVIAAQVKRLRGANGAGTAHIMVPVAPGVITSTAQLDDVVVTVNGVEQAAELEARGQHPDGSYNVIAGRVAIASVSQGAPITAGVTLNGSPTVSRTSVGGQYGYTPNRSDPRLAGYPEVVLVPTSAEYLSASQLTGPYALQPATDVDALGGQHRVCWRRFVDHSAWWWDKDAGSGPYGTAPSAANIGAYSEINTSNTDYLIWNNLTDPTNDWAQWRLAVGVVTNSFYPPNGYDLGNAHIEAWLMTADTDYLLRGLSYIAHYICEYLAKDPTPNKYSVDGFRAFPKGCAAYYLLTGDVEGKKAVEGMADRYFRNLVATTFPASGGVGFGALESDPPGTQGGTDPRNCARILQTALAGHRIRSTQTFDGGSNTFPIDYPAWAETVKDRVLATGANRLRRADGTWRETRCTDASGLFLNTFMNALLAWELAQYYDQIDPDPNIITAIEQLWNTLYPALWDFWKYTFNGTTWFTAEVKSFRQWFDNDCTFGDPFGGNSSALTQGFWPIVGAWLYARTGNPDYLTEAEDVFDQGVGTGMGSGQGPVIQDYTSGESAQIVSRKNLGEAYHNLWPYFTLRLGA